MTLAVDTILTLKWLLGHYFSVIRLVININNIEKCKNKVVAWQIGMLQIREIIFAEI